MHVLILIAIAALAAAAFLAWTYWWPLGPCPRCAGRRGRGWGSTPRAYNRCGRCDGGERIRPLSLTWPVHRTEARRRREARRARR